MIGRLLVVLAAGLALTHPALAHEVRPAYLELRQTADDSFDVLWKVPAKGDDLRLALYVRFLESVEATDPIAVYAGSAYEERWTVRDPGGLVGSTIRIDGLSGTLIEVLVRIERLDGTTQTQRLTPEAPSLNVEASPSRVQVGATYFVLGFEHILLGIDHLLFVLALVLLVDSWRRLVVTITAFTVAHSVTLAAATLGVVRIPGPPVEACIALSILFVAAEIIRSQEGISGFGQRAPWPIAFGFGLLHGLGFAGALSEVGLPQHAIPLALFFFNVGVEVGQLAFLSASLGVLALLRRLPIDPPLWAARLAPTAIGAIAMFWVIERVAGFFD